MSPKRVKVLIGAFKKNMGLTIPFSRRRRATSQTGSPNAEGRVRKSAFAERFDLTDFGGPDLETDNNHSHGSDKKEGELNTGDVAELLVLNTAAETATFPTSQPQPQPPSIITSEDPNIISGIFNTNTAWLRENLSDILPPEAFLPHGITQSQLKSEQDTKMGKKKTAKQAARRKHVKAAAEVSQQSSTPSTPAPETSTKPDVPKGPASNGEAKDEQSAQDPSIGPQNIIASPTVGSGTKFPETTSTNPSSGTQPAKDSLIVDPKLFGLVTDIGIFTRWKQQDFLNLSRNDLLVFIHLYRRDMMPTAKHNFGQVRRIFFNEVYGEYYWISWVRDIVLAFLRSSSAAELAGEETVATLKTAAEDVDFLGKLAPEFKALCLERLAQYNARRIEASEEEGKGTGMPKENPGGIQIDVSVGSVGGKKCRKKKIKGKGKEREGDGGEEEEEEAASPVSQVLEVKDIDSLVTAFAAALLRSCS
ncbi:hypothetical protein EYR41_005759 [Orbilia oligospora]|uniref:Uncharacterized protein n=1 Tax=Orbilia oligospora TaxID=2813651 RepID=A0A7C8KD45_ORBOL|nr:hypothetical protein TWF751_007106 [Orbilia oligospora]TGJ69740.1 hypothetical protein EYR41_005759 [Orbilia oligospora]